MFVVQHLWSHWTKASRPAAAGRPRLDDAYPLRLPAAPAPAWLHDVRRLEQEGFELAAKSEPLDPETWSHASPPHPANLRWRMAGADVRLSLTEPWPSVRRTSWPAHLPEPIAVLRPGDVVTIDWNARFAASAGGSHGGYFYAEHRYWCANTASPTPELFTDATPRKHLDLRTRIY